jgi:hypothetical protein
MHTNEFTVPRNVECNRNPRRDAWKQYFACGVQRPKALNQQPVITRWTAEPKRENDGDSLTDDKNGQRYCNEPRPTEDKHGKHADEQKRESKARPYDDTRFGVESARGRLLNRVHFRSNDSSSATRPTGRVDCNRSALAGFAAGHG